MKKVNNFQIANVQHQDIAYLLLNFFYQFQPGVAYKSVAYKKSVYCRSSHSQMFFKIGVIKNFAIFTEKNCVGVSFC